MQRVRIKICGITSNADALAAASAGADAIGMVFWNQSPRRVTPEQAVAICRDLPPFLFRVALFVDPDPDLVRCVVESTVPDCLQFHGSERADFCESFGRPYIKAVRVQGRQDPLRTELEHPQARALLLDAHERDAPGGTGRAFDWTLVPPGLGKPIILAGGLNAGNVAEAIATVRPYAVDVSGGVESARGVKDPSKIKAFVEAALGENPLPDGDAGSGYPMQDLD